MHAALLPRWPSYVALVSLYAPLYSFSPSTLQHGAFVRSDTFPDSLEDGKDACSAIHSRPKQTMPAIKNYEGPCEEKENISLYSKVFLS